MKIILVLLLTLNLIQTIQKKKYTHKLKHHLKQKKRELQVFDRYGKTKKIKIDESEDKPLECKISDSPFYQICQKIKVCDLCSAVEYCGWCGKSQQCIPGSTIAAACPNDCINGWITKSYGCKKFNVFGRMTNLKTDSTFLLNAEIADPKILLKLHRNREYADPILNKEIDVGFSRVTEKQYLNDGEHISKNNMDQKQNLRGKLETVIHIPIEPQLTYYDSNGDIIHNHLDRAYHGINSTKF